MHVHRSTLERQPRKRAIEVLHALVSSCLPCVRVRLYISATSERHYKTLTLCHYVLCVEIHRAGAQRLSPSSSELNVALVKGLAPALTSMFLVDPSPRKIFLPPRQKRRKSGTFSAKNLFNLGPVSLNVSSPRILRLAYKAVFVNVKSTDSLCESTRNRRNASAFTSAATCACPCKSKRWTYKGGRRKVDVDMDMKMSSLCNATEQRRMHRNLKLKLTSQLASCCCKVLAFCENLAGKRDNVLESGKRLIRSSTRARSLGEPFQPGCFLKLGVLLGDWICLDFRGVSMATQRLSLRK